MVNRFSNRFNLIFFRCRSNNNINNLADMRFNFFSSFFLCRFNNNFKYRVDLTIYRFNNFLNDDKNDTKSIKI